jgi:hypothetical protein
VRHIGITVTLPKPMTSGAKSEGRFGKQDFAYRLTKTGNNMHEELSRFMLIPR